MDESINIGLRVKGVIFPPAGRRPNYQNDHHCRHNFHFYHHYNQLEVQGPVWPRLLVGVPLDLFFSEILFSFFREKKIVRMFLITLLVPKISPSRFLDALASLRPIYIYNHMKLSEKL